VEGAQARARAAGDCRNRSAVRLGSLSLLSSTPAEKASPPRSAPGRPVPVLGPGTPTTGPHAHMVKLNEIPLCIEEKRLTKSTFRFVNRSLKNRWRR
jgi:hypothetical protein